MSEGVGDELSVELKVGVAVKVSESVASWVCVRVGISVGDVVAVEVGRIVVVAEGLYVSVNGTVRDAERESVLLEEMLVDVVTLDEDVAERL